MALPVDQLIRPLTRDEVKAKVYSMLAATGVDVTSWQEGAVARTMIAIFCALVAGLTNVVAAVVKGTFLDHATGVWLTLLALYVYNVARLDATFAPGFVTLTNNGGGVFNNVQIGDLLVKNPTTKKTYTNTAIFSLGAGPGTSVVVPIRAVEAGSASTSTANTITELVTTMLGVTCTNASAVVGTDAQSDPSLRRACRDSMGALSPAGPSAAYDYFAKRTPNGSGGFVDVNRSKVITSGTGLATVVVASASGSVSGPDVALIQAYLATTVLPTGQTLSVVSATAVSISFGGTLVVDAVSSKSDTELRALADAKLAAYLQAVPIGGYQKVPGTGKVWLDALEGQVFQAIPELLEVDMSSPVGDTALTSTQVPTFAGGGVSWTISRVSQT